MIIATLSEELGCAPARIEATIKLLDEGNTVPFIARYRKEITGGLDDTQLRTLAERLAYLRELAERKETILAAIEEQGKLTAELKAEILACDTKARLEDLYLPYKKRRVTKADLARQAGIEPLLDQLLAGEVTSPAEAAAGFIAEGFADEKAVLEGARAIFIDRCALDADLVGEVREQMFARGSVTAQLVAGQEEQGAKYKDYFRFAENYESLPSHRILALFRGENEGVLTLNFAASSIAHLDEETFAPVAGADDFFQQLIAERFDLELNPEAKLGTTERWVNDAVRWAWRTKLYVSSSLDVRMRLKERAEEGALQVFATNLKDVLLAAPAGQRATLGLDPGYRNGVKCAVVDATGKLLNTTIVYPHQPQNRWGAAVDELAALCVAGGVELIAIGNGTASRETEKLAAEVAAKAATMLPKAPIPVVVSESGASIYSASALAAAEFPQLDVSLRGAVSIARRLQDPLAELVKIDPQSIGVGQYQHDVNQLALARTLDGVVEDAVNSVGVDVNTASVQLLSRVAGITASLAENIVAYRDENGKFVSRKELKKVPRLGPKAFEQAAGFLRIRGGEDPLDASAVHPEAYPVVRKIAQETGVPVTGLIGNSPVLTKIDPAKFADETFGIPTVTDIVAELDKPGRDPRPEFKTATFKEGVHEIADLKVGMILEGTVTNVAAFGAFVDVGVHQDGLVHVSAMSHNFVSDPHDVVRSGQVVKVKVMEVDVPRQRIGLSLRLDDEPGAPAKPQGQPRNHGGDRPRNGGKQSRRQAAPAAGGSLAAALRNAGFGH